MSAWTGLLAESTDMNVLYQSPEWFGYLEEHLGGGRLAVALARGAGGQVAGVVPLRVAPYYLAFHVAGTTLGGFRLTKLSVPSGRLLIPECEALYDGLFVALHSALPECDMVGLDVVAEGSFLRHYLQESKRLRDLYLPYPAEGVRRYHTVPLPGTFEEYLAKFNAKKRYNLRRQVRVLRDHGAGSLQLQGVDSPGQVNTLLDVATALWPGYVPDFFCPVADRHGAYRRYTALAARGLLRSYLLRCGRDYVACALGVQHRDVWVVEATMYDKAFARFSPGAVLQLLAVQDLISRRPVRLINFGFGDPASGYAPTNVSIGAASFLLFRKTLANRMRQATHAAFESALASAKGVATRLGLKSSGR
jgi:hypothetical protein